MTSQANRLLPLNGNDMLQTDEYWMQHAIELAKTAEANQEVPVGAVLVFNNEKIAEGWNRPISSCDPSAHAEMIALREGAKKLNNYRLLDTTLYVTLEPCIMCVGAITHARVKRVVYGAYDFRSGAVKSVFNMEKEQQHLNHRVIYEGGILAEDCAKLLTGFFRVRR